MSTGEWQRTGPLDRIARASALAVLGLVLTTLLPASGRASAAQPDATRPALPAGLEGADWVRVQYAQLLDESALVRTGHPLTAAVRDPGLRGAVQPVIDRYSYLLQHAVAILNGPDPLAHTSVTEHYPPGTPQPAWVAIFHGGRVHAVADGEDHVRLFLEGMDPDTAYAQHYSVVRHCLNALLPGDGRPLQVEVYAYQHDYAASELRLNTRCSRLSGASFPSKRKELDLTGLSTFLKEGSVLEGAQLSRTEGLVLYGRPGRRLTLCGEPVSLADLAVVYRAAFHAGDNQAFVSLDEHADPARATVNFGGFLQDTRIGLVVLEADKRLKTITGGLDPNTHRDVRRVTRDRIPSFMSASERDLATGGQGAGGGWIAARLWFYPHKAGVETDPNYEFATITHPQFTVDAERSRKRFVSGDGIGPAASAISPGTRQSIDDLNTHYAEYAEAFPELDELNTVARLMALASWLRKASPDWLDLDALLAVELPACTTERERVNLLTATVVSCPAQDRVDAAYLAANAKLLHLTRVLGRSIGEHFETPEQLASYLRILRGAPSDEKGDEEARAADILAQQGADPVRSLIQTRRNLRALAEYEVGASEAGLSSSLSALTAEIESSENELGRLEAEIASVKSQLSSAEGATYNRLIDQHNALVREHGATVSRHREQVLRYNAARVRTTAVMEIAGGVDLNPRSFQILATTNGERLAEIRAVARSIEDGDTISAHGSEWVRSQAASIPAPPLIPVLRSADWQVTLGSSAENAALAYAQSASRDRAWGTLVSPDGSWRSGLQQAAADYCESEFNPREGKLSVRKVVTGKVVQHLVGGVPAAGLIVFEHVKVRDVLATVEKPFKWLGKIL